MAEASKAVDDCDQDMGFGARPLVGDALQWLDQPRGGVDTVHLVGLPSGGDSGPRATSAIGSGKQAVFPRDCLALMARSTMLDPSSMRPSLRNRSKMSRRVMP